MAKVAKFELQDLLGIGMTLVVLGIGIAFGLNVISDVQGDFTVDSIEYNATADAMEGVAKIPSKLPLIATVVIAAIVIGILLRYLFAPFVGRGSA